MENARLNLAVLLFPDLNENFTVVDDLDSATDLPPFPDVQTMAARQNPDLRAAAGSASSRRLSISGMRGMRFCRRLASTRNYGIEANAFALHSTVAAVPEKRAFCRISATSSWAISIADL